MPSKSKSTPPQPKKKKNYTDEDMLNAIQAARDGQPVAAAAKSYGVPRVTLMDKLAGRSPQICVMGRKTVLSSEEEQIIVNWILTSRKSGFPVSKDQLLISVGQLMKDLKRENPFTNNVPGRRWYELFLERHPEVRERESQNLTSARANISKEQLVRWFREVREHFHEKGYEPIFNDETRVFNCDESAFFLAPNRGKVLARRGDKTVYNLAANNERECLTALVMCNAAGMQGPPMAIYPYERIPSSVVMELPDGWGIGKSDSGWMTAELFFEYVANVFEPWLQNQNIQRPVVLFLDGHTSHLTYHLSEFCKKKEIELVALFPNATHILQPLDVAVFHPVKLAWRKAVAKWRIESNGQKLKREKFAPLLKTVLDEAITPSMIQNGFKTCGLLKLDPNDVNFDKLITKKNTSEDVTTIQMQRELKNHLLFFEKRIGPEKVVIFKEGGPINLQDQSLFELWRGLDREVNKEDEKKEEPNTAVEEPTSNEEQPGPSDDREALNISLNFDGDLEQLIGDVDLGGIDFIELDLPVTNVISGVEVTNIIEPENQEPASSVTQQETTPEKISNAPSNVPSPFKQSLFWPGEVGQKTKKKKEKIPSVVTSEKWKEFYLKKEEAKKKLEEEKTQRKRVREEKLKARLEKADGQKKKKPRNEMDNQSQHIGGCDSDESEQNTANDTFDIEDPSLLIKPKSSDLKSGQWVVVPYKSSVGGEHYFVGQILSLDELTAQIKFLKKKEKKFVWPDVEDIDPFVPLEDILHILKEPNFDRYGSYTFPN